MSAINKRTLYKMSKTGKVIVWSILWNKEEYWTESGDDGGAMTATLPTKPTPKFVGQSNETTIEEQVEKEVLSRISKQYDLNYRDTKPNNRLFEVSLANKYQDRIEKGKLDFPYICQPKLDGIRCYITLVDGEIKTFSRNHKEFKSVPHLKDDYIIKSIFKNYPSIVLDGELYNHELKSDFPKICSIIAKKKPTEQDLEESKKMILFNCFDCFMWDKPNLTYTQRNEDIALFVKSRMKDIEFGIEKLDKTDLLGYLTFVDSCCFDEGNGYNYIIRQLNSVEEVEDKIKEYIKFGYEGIMLKKDTPYCFGRSNNLLKYKKFKDNEYEIIDIEDGEGNSAEVAAAILCKDSRGVTFKAGVIGTVEFRKDMFSKKASYIGKTATVKYQELTPDNKDGTGGVPRFGKVTQVDRESLEGK